MSAPADDADRGTRVARWYSECGPRLFRYAVMLLTDRRDAEDVLQQVFASVLADSRVKPAEPEAYLRTAVRNAAYSCLRRRRTARAAAGQILEPVTSGCSPAEQAALEQALRLLSPEQREVVHLHVYEGMTFQEVARATGESINTVAARYRYALARLRRTLE
jgi:RNA polymerase sigma factor (sigma-70 family)